MKQLVADEIAKRVKNGETIGIGSGSTAELAIEAIGKRIKTEYLRIFGVPTSHRSGMLAEAAGVTVLSSVSAVCPDWAFDGADEVDPEGNLIKGNGAAMLNEKIIALRAKSLVIIVSEDKLVQKLGSKFAVPVEVIPEAVDLVKRGLEQLGASEIVLRESAGKYGPVVTEHNNLVLDARFSSIEETLEAQIKEITGVVESGLFIGYASEILVGKTDSVSSVKATRTVL